MNSSTTGLGVVRQTGGREAEGPPCSWLSGERKRYEGAVSGPGGEDAEALGPAPLRLEMQSRIYLHVMPCHAIEEKNLSHIHTQIVWSP